MVACIVKGMDGMTMTLDARGVPTAGCPACGSSWLNVPVLFDPDTYEISAYGTEAECYGCGTLVTACTPVDVNVGMSDGEN